MPGLANGFFLFYKKRFSNVTFNSFNCIFCFLKFIWLSCFVKIYTAKSWQKRFSNIFKDAIQVGATRINSNLALRLTSSFRLTISAYPSVQSPHLSICLFPTFPLPQEAICSPHSNRFFHRCFLVTLFPFSRYIWWVKKTTTSFTTMTATTAKAATATTFTIRTFAIRPWRRGRGV